MPPYHWFLWNLQHAKTCSSAYPSSSWSCESACYNVCIIQIHTQVQALSYPHKTQWLIKWLKCKALCVKQNSHTHAHTPAEAHDWTRKLNKPIRYNYLDNLMKLQMVSEINVKQKGAAWASITPCPACRRHTNLNDRTRGFYFHFLQVVNLKALWISSKTQVKGMLILGNLKIIDKLFNFDWKTKSEAETYTK